MTTASWIRDASGTDLVVRITHEREGDTYAEFRLTVTDRMQQ